MYCCTLSILAKRQSQCGLRIEYCCPAPAQNPSLLRGYIHCICKIEQEVGLKELLEILLAVLDFP